MRLLLIAPPGAGKGTQAVRLASHYGIEHLSSGSLFRKEVAAGTAIGQEAAGYLARGDLVPDDLVMQILLSPVLEAARRGGYVLDGFPRNIQQAHTAYEWAQGIEGVELQAVVHMTVSRSELRRRLLGRAATEGRIDDRDPAVIEHRLDIYESETRPLLAFYSGRGLLVDVDGDQPEERVLSDIVAALESLTPDAPSDPQFGPDGSR